MHSITICIAKLSHVLHLCFTQLLGHSTVHRNDSVDLRALVRVRRWIDVVRRGWGDILHAFVRKMFRRMPLLSFNARLMYLGSEMKGITIYGWGKELFDTIGLALQHHHSLHTIRTLTRHRKLETENYDVKISCDSIIQSLLSQWRMRSHIW